MGNSLQTVPVGISEDVSIIILVFKMQIQCNDYIILVCFKESSQLGIDSLQGQDPKARGLSKGTDGKDLSPPLIHHDQSRS